MSGMVWDTTELDRAIAAVSRESRKADAEIVTYNGRTLLKAIVAANPRDTGASRGGWYPSWHGLEMPGMPRTRAKPGRYHKRGHGLVQADGSTNKDGKPKRVYVVDGGFVDERARAGEAAVEFVNRTYCTSTRKGRETKLYYPYVLNAKDRWMQRAADSAAFRFGEIYDKMLAKHGA